MGNAPDTNPEGKIWIGCDYRVTVNPQPDTNQYPLPKSDDLFHMLFDGKKFSKLDLSDAYMQIELQEECQKYTAIKTHKGLFQYIWMTSRKRAPGDVTHLRRLRRVLEGLAMQGLG